MMRAILIAAALAILASPAHADTLHDTIVKDLLDTADFAHANGDIPGEVCARALAKERLNLIVLPPKPGVFMLIEAARLSRQNASKPIISDAAASACGPVARDIGATIAQLAARAGLAAIPLPFPKF